MTEVWEILVGKDLSLRPKHYPDSGFIHRNGYLRPDDGLALVISPVREVGDSQCSPEVRTKDISPNFGQKKSRRSGNLSMTSTLISDPGFLTMKM